MGKRRPTYRGAAVRLRVVGKALLPSDCAGSGDERSVVAVAHPSYALCQDNPRPPSPAGGIGGM
jgi:hypothetical protein